MVRLLHGHSVLYEKNGIARVRTAMDHANSVTIVIAKNTAKGIDGLRL